MKKLFIEYTVEGIGTFPVDMLRYDCSFPSRESDSHQIETTFTGPSIAPGPTRLMRMKPRDGWEPTKGRWESFGWSVVEILSE